MSDPRWKRFIIFLSTLGLAAWIVLLVVANGLLNQVKSLQRDVSDLKKRTRVIGVDNRGILSIGGNMNMRKK